MEIVDDERRVLASFPSIRAMLEKARARPDEPTDIEDRIVKDGTWLDF